MAKYNNLVADSSIQYCGLIEIDTGVNASKYKTLTNITSV